MSKRTDVICDYCTASAEEDDEEILQGWIHAEKFDSLREDLRELDFCSDECASAYFS